tara:strand:- start:624 stop:1274 length:651 start_codon:yes stop_codon:yes gene_type:complete
MIIISMNFKGGVSKSTNSVHFAVRLQQLGHRVLLVDADPQGTAKDWLEDRREKNEHPNLRFAEVSGNCTADLKAFESDGFTVVVDTAGSDSDTARYAAKAATHIIIPIKPKNRDLKVLDKQKEIIDNTLINNPDAIVRSVVCQAPTHPNEGYRIDMAKGRSEAWGITPLDNWQCLRNVYDDSDEVGATVFEHRYSNKVDEKAVREMTNIVDEILKL